MDSVHQEQLLCISLLSDTSDASLIIHYTVTLSHCWILINYSAIPVILTLNLTHLNHFGAVGRTPVLRQMTQGQWQDSYNDTSQTISVFCDEKERDKSSVTEGQKYKSVLKLDECHCHHSSMRSL